MSEWETKVKNLKDELMQLEGQRKGRQCLFGLFVFTSIFKNFKFHIVTSGLFGIDTEFF